MKYRAKPIRNSRFLKEIFLKIKNKLRGLYEVYRSLLKIEDIQAVVIIFVAFVIATYIFSLSYIITGFYPFGRPVVVMLPRDIPSFIFFVLILVIVFPILAYGLYGISGEMAHRFDKKLVIVLVMLFLLLYLYNIDGHHVSLMDSYEIIGGALEIINNYNYPLLHKASFGASLAIIPFMLLCIDEICAQIGIIFFEALMIILSVKLWKKVTIFNKDEASFYWFFVILLIINPMYVAITRTISYEPFAMTLFVTLLLINVEIYKRKSYENIKRMIFLLSIQTLILAMLIVVRVNYIILFALPTLFGQFLHWLRMFFSELKNNRRLELRAILYIMLIGAMGLALYILSLRLVPVWLKKNTTKTALRIFDISHVLVGLPSSAYIVVSFINSPASRKFFPYALIAGKLLLINIVLGYYIIHMLILFIKNELKGELKPFFRYIFLFILTNVGFYSLYGGWQGRYLIFTIYLLLFLLSKQIYFIRIKSQQKIEIPYLNKKRLRYLKAAILLLGLIAASNSAIAVAYWNNVNVQYDSSAGLVDDELGHLFLTIKNYSSGNAILFTTYEALALFYKYKYNLSTEIFFVYRYFIENTINETSVLKLLELIRNYLERGYTVLYLAGWPELDNYSPPSSDYPYKYFYDALKSTFKYEVLIVGPVRARASWNYKAPIYELLLLRLP